MEYLVMECHASYAVVLDSRGRFKKVANLNYTVGQELETVVEMAPPRERGSRWKPILTAAACLCILLTGLWQMMLLSMGTVLIQINPQIRLHVNRMERVIRAEAVNADGAKVLFSYQAFGKTVEQAAWELSDRAADMGYLSDGGEVHLTVASEHAEWKAQTERRLETVIVHDAQNVTVIIGEDDWDDPDDRFDDLDDALNDDLDDDLDDDTDRDDDDDDDHDDDNDDDGDDDDDNDDDDD